MTERETREEQVFLVIVEGVGLFGAYLDEDVARKRAKASEGVVAAVPVLADYRAGDEGSRP